MTDKEKDSIKERLREALLDKKKENKTEIISKEQAQKESERDIVLKSEDNTILPREDK